MEQDLKATARSAAASRRRAQWDVVRHSTFDVAIIGAGVNGASLYRELCRYGYRVLLVDAKDFAAGTSQASAMMIWGGLLYLRNLDLATVWRFCTSRDRMIQDEPASFRACPFRLVPAGGRWRSIGLRAVLNFYWLLGACRRHRPAIEHRFPEQDLLVARMAGQALRYEEGIVASSDARMVGDRVFAYRGPYQVPLNYCRLAGGGYDRAAGVWKLELEDTLGDADSQARARVVVNVAGVWTDAVNRRFGRESPYRHVFSKGVFLGLPRASDNELPLIVRTRSDYHSLIPWGPVSLWGPTETVLSDPARGFHVEPGDVRYLEAEYNSCFSRPVDIDSIVSWRCGVRPLAVPRNYVSNGNSLHLSRASLIHVDAQLPWVSVYGGKLTGCSRTARVAAAAVEPMVPSGGTPEPVREQQEPSTVPFPGLPGQFPSPEWCADHEQCFTLEDYLRRRTNIAQWVPRGGLGFHDEHLPHLREIANAFAWKSDRGTVAVYRDKVRREFDSVMREVCV